MKIIFMGTPKFASNILQHIIKKHDIVCVVTQPDKTVGRKKEIVYSETKEVALKHNLKIFQPVKLSQDYQELLKLDADLIVTAAYGQMLPKELLMKFKAINVHGSILPTYRGGAPIQYALFDGIEQTGITIMWMAQKMDSGDVISYAFVDILEEDNFETLADKLSDAGSKELLNVLNILEEKGSVKAEPQNHELATFAYNITRFDEFVDFTETSDTVKNRLRGLLPNIGISIKVNNVDFKIYKLKEKNDIIIDENPGTITIDKGLFINSSDGLIEILEIQAPGKKRMLTKDFLNGQTIIKNKDIVVRKDDFNA